MWTLLKVNLIYAILMNIVWIYVSLVSYNIVALQLKKTFSLHYYFIFFSTVLWFWYYLWLHCVKSSLEIENTKYVLQQDIFLCGYYTGHGFFNGAPRILRYCALLGWFFDIKITRLMNYRYLYTSLMYLGYF